MLLLLLQVKCRWLTDYIFFRFLIFIFDWTQFSVNNMGRNKWWIQINRSRRSSQTMGWAQIKAQHELRQIKSRIKVIARHKYNLLLILLAPFYWSKWHFALHRFDYYFAITINRHNQWIIDIYYKSQLVASIFLCCVQRLILTILCVLLSSMAQICSLFIKVFRTSRPENDTFIK